MPFRGFTEKNFYRSIFGELGSGKSTKPSLPPQEKGLSPEGDSDLKFKYSSADFPKYSSVEFFSVLSQEFLVRAPGHLPNAIVIELFW